MSFVANGGGVSYFSQAGDVALSNVQGSHTIGYDSNIQKWVNKTPSFVKVIHGTNANTPRPAASYVLWEGSVQPANWVDGDDWNEVI